MAGAAITLAATAIGVIGPQLPTIVHAIEALFGHSSATGKQEGPEKLSAGVDLATTMLQAFANAGRMPSASVVDPSLPSALAGALQTIVDQEKAAGKLGPAPQSQQPQPPAGPATTVPASGKQITITGILYGGL